VLARIWTNYDEAAEEALRLKRREENEARQKVVQDLKDVIVTEIVDATKFYIQIAAPAAEQLEDLMKQLSVQPAQGPYAPAKDAIVSAQFTEDDAWYRAKVMSVDADQVNVFYIDYGNSEVIPTSRIRPLPSGLPEVEPQAKEAALAYIYPPTLTEEYGPEAAEFLKDLVWGKTMVANTEFIENGKLYLDMVGERNSGVHVNGALVKAGLAKVAKPINRHMQAAVDKLRLEEEHARKKHLGIFSYGDPGSDGDDL